MHTKCWSRNHEGQAHLRKAWKRGGTMDHNIKTDLTERGRETADFIQLTQNEV